MGVVYILMFNLTSTRSIEVQYIGFAQGNDGINEYRVTEQGEAFQRDKESVRLMGVSRSKD